MSCFETIKVENGKLLNLEYHQQRVDRTREFRLRIDYAKEIKSFTCRESS